MGRGERYFTVPDGGRIDMGGLAGRALETRARHDVLSRAFGLPPPRPLAVGVIIVLGPLRSRTRQDPSARATGYLSARVQAHSVRRALRRASAARHDRQGLKYCFRSAEDPWVRSLVAPPWLVVTEGKIQLEDNTTGPMCVRLRREHVAEDNVACVVGSNGTRVVWISTLRVQRAP